MSCRVALAGCLLGVLLAVPSALASSGSEPSCGWTPPGLLKTKLGLKFTPDRASTGVNGNATDCAYEHSSRTTVTNVTIGYMVSGSSSIQAAYNLVAATPGKSTTLEPIRGLGRRDSKGFSALGTLNGRQSKTAYLELSTSKFSPFVQIEVADGKNTFAVSLSEYRARGAGRVALANPKRYVKALEQIAARIAPKFYAA